jgi:hypothetical protein
MRQRVSRLLYACQVEAAVEARNPNRDLDHIARLCDHIDFFARALAQLEEA